MSDLATTERIKTLEHALKALEARVEALERISSFSYERAVAGIIQEVFPERFGGGLAT